MKTNLAKKINEEDIDRIFDEGKEDVLEYFDLENAKITVPWTISSKVIKLIRDKSIQLNMIESELVEKILKENLEIK